MVKFHGLPSICTFISTVTSSHILLVDVLWCLLLSSHKMKWNGVLDSDSVTVRLYWAGDNLDLWDEFWYEPCPRWRINHLTYLPAVQCAATVLWLLPLRSWCIASRCLKWIVAGTEKEREREREKRRETERRGEEHWIKERRDEVINKWTKCEILDKFQSEFTYKTSVKRSTLT